MAPESDRDELYETFAQGLLLLGSVGDIQRAVVQMPGLDLGVLVDTLDRLADRRAAQGAVDELALLRFVREVVADLAAGDEPSHDDPVGLALTAALDTGGVLRTFFALRPLRGLLAPETFWDLQRELFLERRPQDPVFERALDVLCALGALLDDRKVQAQAHLFWGARCRGAGRLRAASRRFARAEAIAVEIDDPMLTLGAAGAQASLAERAGDLERAAKEFARALAAAGAQGEDAAAASLRTSVVHVLRELGRYGEALAELDAGLGLVQQPGFEEQEAKQRLLRGLLLEDLGRYDEGEAEYEASARLAAAAGDRATEFAARSNVGVSSLKRNQSAEGLRRLREVLRTVTGWANPAMVASAHNNLGQALMQAGRPADALREFGEALGWKIMAGDRFGEAIAYVGLGEAHEELGDLEQARNLYTLALLPWLETGDPSILVTAAPRLAALEEQDEDSQTALRLALDGARRAGEIRLELQMTASMANAFERRGERDEAISLYRVGLGRARELGVSSPDTRRLEVLLARLLAAEPATQQEAFDRLRGALEEVNEQLAGVRLDARRSEIVAEWTLLYGALVDLLCSADGLPVPDPEAEAFALHESAKAQSFVASLADADVAAPPGVPETLTGRERELLALERGLQNWDGTAAGGSMGFRLQRLGEVHDELLGCWREMERFAPEYVALRRGEPSSLENVRALLADSRGPPAALVSLFCTDEGTTAFVLRSDDRELRVFRCPVGREEASSAVAQLRRAFNGDPHAFPPYPPIRRDRPGSRDISAVTGLGRRLLSFAPALEGVELLCIAPHGPLHLLPFHALELPDGRPLAERHATVYCPSVSSLAYTLSRGARSRESGSVAVYVAGVSSRADAHPEHFEGDDVLFDSRSWEVTSDLGPLEASRQHVLNGVREHEFVHVTCHGYFDDDNPLESGLLLSDGRERPPRDPRGASVLERRSFVLSARDLLRTPVAARLVTLRACSTGVQSARRGGDELEGLTRAVIYAGAAAVIVTLWNVDQESSQQLLRRFYGYWRGADGPNEMWRALWLAQRDFFVPEQEPYLSHPYHWAPFVLIGDWR